MFSINYVHSRRAFPEDRLYIPNRPKDAARDVLEEFFAELESLAKSEKLSPMYADAFSPSQTRRGKLRHWLLRSVHVEDGDLAKLRKQGVSMIGDVVNVEPIVGRCPVVPIMSSHRLCVLHTNLRWDGEVVWTFRTGTSQDTSSPSPSPGKRMLQHVWKTYMLSSQQRLRLRIASIRLPWSSSAGLTQARCLGCLISWGCSFCHSNLHFSASMSL